MKRLLSLIFGLVFCMAFASAQMDTLNMGTGGFYNGGHVVYSAEKGYTLKKNLELVNTNFEELYKRGSNSTVVAAGTVYDLTGTAALLNFGTTDPEIVIADTGDYLIIAKADFKLLGATYAKTGTLTAKLRRINNTAADLTGASVGLILPVVTTDTAMVGTAVIPLIYTANDADTIQFFGSVSATPSAGKVQCIGASIVAVKISE